MGKTVRAGVFDIRIYIETREGTRPGPYFSVADERGNVSLELFDEGVVTVEEGRAIYAAALRYAAEKVARDG